MERVSVAESELLEALQQAFATAAARPEGALSAVELSKVTGKTVQRVHKGLRKQIDAGLIECTRVPFTYIDGRAGSVVAYRATRAPTA